MKRACRCVAASIFPSINGFLILAPSVHLFVDRLEYIDVGLCARQLPSNHDAKRPATMNRKCLHVVAVRLSKQLE